MFPPLIRKLSHCRASRNNFSPHLLDAHARQYAGQMFFGDARLRRDLAIGDLPEAKHLEQFRSTFKKFVQGHGVFRRTLRLAR